MHFFHKYDSYEIIKNIKDNIKIDGMVYIYVFSTNDPRFQKYTNSAEFDKLENNIFHHKTRDTYISFFTKDEILDLFKDFKTICISDEYSLDLGGKTPQYCGFIKYIGKK